MIKIGIDPSGTGTTVIVVYEDNKLIEKLEFKHRNWMYYCDNIILILSKTLDKVKNPYKI